MSCWPQDWWFPHGQSNGQYYSIRFDWFPLFYENIINGYIVVILTTVDIAESPSFVSVIRPETLAEYGSTVVLPCEAIGVPAPNITWLRNARDVLSLPQKERLLKINLVKMIFNSTFKKIIVIFFLF